MPTFNNMDLNLLRVFQAIAEERSLTLAGNRLHLSQPAVSYALGRLRGQFNDPLFIRTKEGMQPTPTATELSKSIGRALQAVQEALSYGEQFEPLNSTRVFRTSMTDAAEMFFLPPVCEYLDQHAPNTKLQITQVTSTTIDDALRTGHLDFAIGNLPSLKATTRHEVLFSETYVCLTRKRQGLPSHAKLTREEFLEMSHVQVRSAESSHYQLEEAFRLGDLDRKIALDIPHFSVLPQILGRSDLAVTLPLRIAKLFNTEDMFSKNLFAIYGLPIDLAPVDVTLHWHAEFENEPGNRWLREMIIDLLQEYGRKV